MRIEISDYESPHTLRALATLLTTLADAPTFEKGCAEPCDTPEPLPGRPCAYEPFDIFPNELAAPSTQPIIGTPFVGNHEARIQTAPMTPGEIQFIAPHSSPQAGMPSKLTLTQFVPPPGYEVVGQVHDETILVPAPPVATDKTGAPWDARIHSSSKALVADGTWRRKKGVDKSLVESVTRELKFAQYQASEAISSVHGEEDDSEMRAVIAALHPAPVEDAHVLRVLDAALVPPPPPLGAAPLPPAPPLPFNEIMRFFAVHSMAGKLTHADMEAMAKHSGVELTQELINAAHADKRPAALAYLQDLVDQRTAKSSRV